MTQPTQSAHDLKQYAVKEHVKGMLRKIPRNQRDGKSVAISLRPEA